MRMYGAVHKMCVLAFAMLAFSFCLARNSAAEQAPYVRTVGGVIDFANILSPEQKRPLEIAAGQLARRISTDMFVVTVNDRDALWADQKSHYAMVERAFADVQLKIREHFNRDAPLTVLLVFKSSVVLHLKTSDERLQDDLIYQNFYSKSAGALERIRRPDETHDAAALRYLSSFNGTLDAIAAPSQQAGLFGQTERVRQWIVRNFAMDLSRTLVETPVLDPLYKLSCSTITFLATHLPMPGWLGFLYIIGSIFIGLHVAAFFIEKRFGGPGEFAANALLVGGLALPLFMLFAVSMPDIENLLVIAQKYNDESSVLLTYLDWSSAIEEHSFAMPFEVIAFSAFAIAGMEFVHRLRQFKQTFSNVRNGPKGSPQDGRWMSGFRRLRAASQLPFHGIAVVVEVLKTLGWVLSQVIWAGPIAAFFIMVTAARRVADLWSSSASADERTPVPRKKSINQELQSGGRV